MNKPIRLLATAQVVACLAFLTFYNSPISPTMAITTSVLCIIALLVSIAIRELRTFAELPDKVLFHPWPNQGIYLLKADNNLYKIGKSTNIAQRQSDLSLASPHDLTLEHVIRTANLNKAEAYLHDLFKARRVKGEWFALTGSDIIVIRGIVEL